MLCCLRFCVPYNVKIYVVVQCYPKLVTICDSPWENREKGERTGTLK